MRDIYTVCILQGGAAVDGAVVRRVTDTTIIPQIAMQVSERAFPGALPCKNTSHVRVAYLTGRGGLETLAAG